MFSFNLILKKKNKGCRKKDEKDENAGTID
jgi:hypothetical protein